ncbi:IS3 family transposase [Yoonia sp. 2307UL14-13]|uniref:IS3 family transposase n=1 Tax=Yoonia sp. 2307UL14-13 TaxID=3126506 RepID=UPI00309D999A
MSTHRFTQSLRTARIGYRRVHVILERQGWRVNQKKLRRPYREEKLQVRKLGGRKHALRTRRSMLVPQRRNECWNLDTAIMVRRGRPRTIVNDNGTELAGMAVLTWCQETQID